MSIFSAIEWAMLIGFASTFLFWAERMERIMAISRKKYRFACFSIESLGMPSSLARTEIEPSIRCGFWVRLTGLECRYQGWVRRQSLRTYSMYHYIIGSRRKAVGGQSEYVWMCGYEDLRPSTVKNLNLRRCCTFFRCARFDSMLRLGDLHPNATGEPLSKAYRL